MGISTAPKQFFVGWTYLGSPKRPSMIILKSWLANIINSGTNIFKRRSYLNQRKPSPRSRRDGYIANHLFLSSLTNDDESNLQKDC